jgi:hypothetical protein
MRASRRESHLQLFPARQTASDAATVLRGNANGRYVTGVIRFEQANHKASHRAVLSYDTVRN